MKKAYITCGLIFEDKDAASIIAQDKMIHEIDVNDYADILRTEIEIEIDKYNEQAILTVYPVESKLDFDLFCNIRTECDYKKEYDPEYIEYKYELYLDGKPLDKILSAKLIEKIQSKVELHEELNY